MSEKAGEPETGEEERGAVGRPEDGGPEEEPARFDRRMLEALVCPVSQERLEWDAGRAELVSRKAGLAYPVRDGIPIMLESEARVLDP